MADLTKLIRSPRRQGHFDGLFSQWGAIGSGLVFLVLAAGTFRKWRTAVPNSCLGSGRPL